MILGIGNDIISISRIAKLLDKEGGRFERRVFTEHEIKHCRSQKNYAASFAKRFAAKEAFLKALGTGLAKGTSWQDLEVYNRESGQPGIKVFNKTRKLVNEKLPPFSKYNEDRGLLQPHYIPGEPFENLGIMVTLSDDADIAQAIVMIQWLTSVSVEGFITTSNQKGFVKLKKEWIDG